MDVGLADVQAAVSPHAGDPMAHLGLCRGENPLGVVRVVTGQESEPWLN